MHGLIDAQGLDVGPVEHPASLAWHLLRVEQRRELHVPGARSGLEAAQQIAEWESDPGNDHRPGFDAAVAVDALLERVRADDVLDRKFSGLRRLTGDRYRPRPGVQ